MNRKWIEGGVALVLLLLVGAWWLGWFHREDPLVAEVKELAAQPQSKDNDKAMRDMMRERMQGLSEEQRMAMFEKMAPIFMPLMAARFEQEYDKFMAMSEEERNKELDKRIAEMTRRGGQVVLVGVPSRDVFLNIEVFADVLLQERKILGCWYGSSDPHRDVPRLIERYLDGTLLLDELVSRTIHLDEVNDAFAAMERGEVARSVIDYQA